MKSVLAGCVALCALAVASSSTRAEEAVRVYTNADIERLAPLPSQGAPLVPFDKERWEYVIQFLEREHSRLNADRDHELAREILRAEVEAAKSRPRYVVAVAPYRGFHRRPHRARRGTGAFP